MPHPGYWKAADPPECQVGEERAGRGQGMGRVLLGTGIAEWELCAPFHPPGTKQGLTTPLS